MYGYVMYALTRNTGSLFAPWLGYGLYVSTEKHLCIYSSVEIIYRFMYIQYTHIMYCEGGEAINFFKLSVVNGKMRTNRLYTSV
jgi:hypothetical protein